MKKFLSVCLMFLCCSLIFAQSVTYQKLLNDGKNYESKNQYIHALVCYSDAINLGNYFETTGARILYDGLLYSIKGGNPGRGTYNIFSCHDGWLELKKDFESCWKEICPYALNIGKLKITSADYVNRTVSYSFATERYLGEYADIIEAVKQGYKTAYFDWADMPKEWADNINFDYKATVKFVGKKYGTLIKCTVPVKSGVWTVKNISEDIMEKMESDDISVECIRLVNSDGVDAKNLMDFSEMKIYHSSEGKVLRICAWNEEFQSCVKDFYPGYNKDTDMIGDVKVEWIITPSNGNAYQNKLDTDLAAQSSAKADDKIDLFLVESDYALKYTDTAYAMDVKDLGITDADIADQFKYTKDIMTSSDGKLKGLTWQACPGGFVYRRSYARDILGTDDPDEVQAALSDWTKFNAVAAKAKARGYCMVSGYDDDFRVFSDNVKSPWVINGKINIDDSIKEWVKQTKLYTEKGYNQKTSLWSFEWTQGMMKDGKVFGYFGPAWFVDFCMPHWDGAAFGDWAFCKGPQGFSWGGTWICAATGTDNPTLVKDIMLKLTCDPEIMVNIAKEYGDFVNNKKAMETIANSGYRNEFLGGQNHMKFFIDSAESIDKSKITAYDIGMCEKFQAAMHEYFDGKVTEEEAYRNFYDTILQVYPNLRK